MVGRHHYAALTGQQRLRIQRVADIAAHPVHRRGHDTVVRPHLTPQPRPESPPGQRVRGPGHLPVIGPCDDVPADAGRGVKDLVSLTRRAAGLVGLAAQPADPHQAPAAPVVVRGQHVIHDACSRHLCGLRKHPGGCDQPASGCEPHHVTHRADGGHTSLANLKDYCWWHHHVVLHELGWTLTVHPDGTSQVQSPDGKIIHSHSPPPRPG